MAEKFVSGDFIGKHLFASKKANVYKTTLGLTSLYSVNPGIEIGPVKALVRGSKVVNKKAVPADTFYFAVKLSDGTTGYVNFLDGDFTSFKAQGVRTDEQKGKEDKKAAETESETFGDKLQSGLIKVAAIAGGAYVLKEMVLTKMTGKR